MVIETIFKVIRSPRKAFEEQIDTLSFILFMILNGGILFLYAISFVKYGLKSLENVFPEISLSFINSLSSFVISYKFLYLSLMLPFVVLFLSSAVYDFLAQMLFNKSNGFKLMKNLAFSSIPLMLARLLFVLFSIFNLSYLQEINIFFLIWEIVLFIFAISKTYDIEVSKANMLFFAPYLLVLLILIPAII